MLVRDHKAQQRDNCLISTSHQRPASRVLVISFPAELEVDAKSNLLNLVAYCHNCFHSISNAHLPENKHLAVLDST